MKMGGGPERCSLQTVGVEKCVEQPFLMRQLSAKLRSKEKDEKSVFKQTLKEKRNLFFSKEIISE